MNWLELELTICSTNLSRLVKAADELLEDIEKNDVKMNQILNDIQTCSFKDKKLKRDFLSDRRSMVRIIDQRLFHLNKTFKQTELLILSYKKRKSAIENEMAYQAELENSSYE